MCSGFEYLKINLNIWKAKYTLSGLKNTNFYLNNNNNNDNNLLKYIKNGTHLFNSLFLRNNKKKKEKNRFTSFYPLKYQTKSHSGSSLF